jgi:hypothetical protein
MRRLIPALALAATMTLTSTAAAEPISAAGAGMMTCANFNEISKIPQFEETIFAWAQGYMSASTMRFKIQSPNIATCTRSRQISSS